MCNKSFVLNNGIKVLTEELPHLNSVSIGIWIKRGSRHEDEKNNGISHFIEHLLFKGTERRSAFDIARDIDSVGGMLNAFTAREYTCFYTKVLGKDLPLAVDILSDIFYNPLFEPDEIDKERGVVLQEIKMVEDTPDDLVHDLFVQNFWKDHPLGLPILGSTNNVNSFSREAIKKYFRKYHFSDSVIISAAGSFKQEELVKLLVPAFGGDSRVAGNPGEEERFSPPSPNPGVIIGERDLEQVHFCLGTSALPLTHPYIYSAYLLNAILGSGMSSRLFQEIREKRGLAYSIFSYLNNYSDVGSLVVYAGADNNTVSEVLSLILKEFDSIRNGDIKESELNVAKEQLKGNMLLGLESSGSIMSRLANDEIYFGRYVPLSEIREEVDKVTLDDIGGLAGDIFLPDRLTLMALGKCEGAGLQIP